MQPTTLEGPTASTSPRPGLGLWIKVARPFSLSAAVSPVLVGTAVAIYAGVFRLPEFLATLVAGLCLQIAANYFNEYFDYRYGLDHAESLGASTVIFRGEMSAAQVLGGGIASFGAAAVLGVVLIFLVGPAIMLFGLAGMAIAYFYSGKPFQFSTRGLGDVMVFLAMGVLMTWGAFYVQIHQWSWMAIAASIPIGCIVTAILNMNNTRDLRDDAAVHKLTLPVRFGERFGQIFHAVLIFGAFVTTTIFVITRVLPIFSLAVWLVFPLAYINVNDVLEARQEPVDAPAPGQRRRAYIIGIQRTAQLHLRFGIVLAAAIALAGLTHIRF